jgi:ATP-dependent Lon protease
MGQQRFQVLEIVRSTPFCSAMVSWINDDNVDNLQTLDSLKDSVIEALSDVINLTSKLTNNKKNLPDKLPNNPMELSFWIGAHLGGPVAEEQQKLLEERNTYTRLQREYEMLDHTRKQLAARTALKESFPDIQEN